MRPDLTYQSDAAITTDMIVSGMGKSGLEDSDFSEEFLQKGKMHTPLWSDNAWRNKLPSLYANVITGLSLLYLSNGKMLRINSSYALYYKHTINHCLFKCVYIMDPYL